jgi:hypothetical protein
MCPLALQAPVALELVSVPEIARGEGRKAKGAVSFASVDSVSWRIPIAEAPKIAPRRE